MSTKRKVQCERVLPLPLGSAYCIKPHGHEGLHEFHFAMSEHELRKARRVSGGRAAGRTK